MSNVSLVVRLGEGKFGLCGKQTTALESPRSTFGGYAKGRTPTVLVITGLRATRTVFIGEMQLANDLILYL